MKTPQGSRLYVDAAQIDGAAIGFSVEQGRHLAKVLRLGRGACVEVTDGRGNEFLVQIEDHGARRGTILQQSRPRRESPLRTILVQAVPKMEKMEFVLQKAVEIGVTEIRPVMSRRSVTGLEGDRWVKRKARWEKIMRAAVGQSGRTESPALADPERWEAFLEKKMRADLKLMFWEEADTGLGDALLGTTNVSSVLLAVGPEGGWAEGEVELARRRDFAAVSLGPRMLRAETAGIVALALLQHRYGDLGGGGAGEDSEMAAESV